MSNILLLEDIPLRQERFMKGLDFSLDKYRDILDNVTFTPKVNQNIEETLQNEEYNDFPFSRYDTLMAHQSMFDSQEVADKLKAYCKAYKKRLILFSGNNHIYYNNDSYDYLALNTKDFYSNNLKVFLDAYRNKKDNILMLAYGKRWELTILLNIVEKVNLFLVNNTDEDILLSSLMQAIGLNQLNNMQHNLYTMKSENGWVYREEVIAFKESISSYIQKFLDV